MVVMTGIEYNALECECRERRGRMGRKKRNAMTRRRMRLAKRSDGSRGADSVVNRTSATLDARGASSRACSARVE